MLLSRWGLDGGTDPEEEILPFAPSLLDPAGKVVTGLGKVGTGLAGVESMMLYDAVVYSGTTESVVGSPVL